MGLDLLLLPQKQSARAILVAVARALQGATKTYWHWVFQSASLHDGIIIRVVIHSIPLALLS